MALPSPASTNGSRSPHLQVEQVARPRPPVTPRPSVSPQVEVPTHSTVPGDIGDKGSLGEPSNTPGNDHDDIDGEELSTPQSNGDGTISQQPLVEPLDWNTIPDLVDALAPKPILGEEQLSAEAIRSRTRRIFTRRGDGTKKVSDEIWDDWHSKGKKKKLLEHIFKQCGYDVESW